jgi:serine beta-lactamase-like protein LACTB
VEEARRLARSPLVDENLPGLSVAVALDGEIVWAEGFGWAEVERGAPVTPLTRFRIGSVSKPLTAAAVGLLHDRGRIDLDAPLSTRCTSPHDRNFSLLPGMTLACVHVRARRIELD